MDTVHYIDNSVSKQNLKTSVTLISDTTNQNCETLFHKNLDTVVIQLTAFLEKEIFLRAFSLGTF